MELLWITTKERQRRKGVVVTPKKQSPKSFVAPKEKSFFPVRVGDKMGK
jgi:hypothetical protein